MKRALPVNSRRFISGETFDEAVENQSGHKGTEDALQANHLGERATEEEDAQDKDKLHDRIAIAAQKPACQSGDEEDCARTVGRKLHGKP